MREDLSHLISKRGNIMLSKESVEALQKIFKEKYGQDLTYEEARESGENLVRFAKMLMDWDRSSKSED